MYDVQNYKILKYLYDEWKSSGDAGEPLTTKEELYNGCPEFVQWMRDRFGVTYFPANLAEETKVSEEHCEQFQALLYEPQFFALMNQHWWALSLGDRPEPDPPVLAATLDLNLYYADGRAVPVHFIVHRHNSIVPLTDGIVVQTLLAGFREIVGSVVDKGLVAMYAESFPVESPSNQFPCPHCFGPIAGATIPRLAKVPQLLSPTQASPQDQLGPRGGFSF